MQILTGKVCLVTGATRGIGKGVALQLAENGAKVYITGRTVNSQSMSEFGGSLFDTVCEIESRGGTCIPVQCDHSDDKDIEKLFYRIRSENNGQLDILINNAYSAANVAVSKAGTPFWELEPDMWDTVNNVGLRNNYICSVYAARLMVPRKQGLIVNMSSAGGIKYVLTPAYGIGKEACDRMAADCALELRKHGVTYISLWPGPVGTETLLAALGEAKTEQAKKRKQMFEQGETVDFVGKCIVALASDPNVKGMSGKIHLTCDIGQRYGLKDLPGHIPINNMVNKSLKMELVQRGHTWLAALIPGFVRIPGWILALRGNKFN